MSETDGRVNRVGVIGGGQLARMMIPAAINLGLDIAVLAEKPHAAAKLAATMVGDYRDADVVAAFARTVDVVTFDHELVPAHVLNVLEEQGVVVRPGHECLAVVRDKVVMRERLRAMNIAMPDWAVVSTAEQLDEFIAQHGVEAVVKRPRGGYDGRGVRVVSSSAHVTDWFSESSGAASGESGVSLLVEERVAFRRELSQLVARRPSGQVRGWSLIETVQRNGVCVETIAPAPGMTEQLGDTAYAIGRAIAEALGVVGVLAVELFETDEGRLLVNELAMRPHNSGHWTIEGSVTSQFEQHVRAVADIPFGDTAIRSPWVVTVNLFGGTSTHSLRDRYDAVLAEHPTAKIHNYGKTSTPGRKLGHVTVSGPDRDEVLYHARAAGAVLNL